LTRIGISKSPELTTLKRKTPIYPSFKKESGAIEIK
jgi:hypothetical protein